MNTIKLSSNKDFPFKKQLKEIVDHIVRTSDTDIVFDPNFIAIDYFSRFNKYKEMYNKLLETYTFRELFYLFSELFYESSEKYITEILNRNTSIETREFVNASYLKTLRKREEPDKLLLIEIDSYISYKSNFSK